VVFFNYTTMQMTAKIVYYGPGLCGKTTNLQSIHDKTASKSRGEMVSLETETDRTLFFDLLPLDVGVIGGMKVRLQLYTVPGQVFYNATRKLVLKGVDGVVFVADSQVAAEDTNVESLGNLKANIAELGLTIDQLPIVFQYNKRDIRNILPVEVLNETLNPAGAPYFEAAALHGVGVFETLKTISRLAISSVRKKVTTEMPARPPTGMFSVQAAAPAAPVPAPAAAPDAGLRERMNWLKFSFCAATTSLGPTILKNQTRPAAGTMAASMRCRGDADSGPVRSATVAFRPLTSSSFATSPSLSAGVGGRPSWPSQRLMFP